MTLGIVEREVDYNSYCVLFDAYEKEINEYGAEREKFFDNEKFKVIYENSSKIGNFFLENFQRSAKKTENGFYLYLYTRAQYICYKVIERKNFLAIKTIGELFKSIAKIFESEKRLIDLEKSLNIERIAPKLKTEEDSQLKQAWENLQSAHSLFQLVYANNPVGENGISFSKVPENINSLRKIQSMIKTITSFCLKNYRAKITGDKSCYIQILFKVMHVEQSANQIQFFLLSKIVKKIMDENKLTQKEVGLLWQVKYS